MKLLRRTQFGNPILRLPACSLAKNEILSPLVQALIADMYHTLQTKRYGVGLAAPQVGQRLSLAIVHVRPTETRPDATEFKLTVINPKIIKTYGRRSPLWEGCISLGTARSNVFAQVPRYKRIRLRYQDEQAKLHERDFEGLVAHVLQHEVDHLNGVLFVDRVKDTHSYVTFAEYKKILQKR